MNKFGIFAILMLTGLAAVYCGKKGGDSQGNPGGKDSDSPLSYGVVNLKGDNFFTPNFTLTSETENCSFSMDIYQGSGSCLTPISVSGFTSSVELAANSEPDPTKGAARVLGVNEETQKGAVISGLPFDFSETSDLVTNNTLWQQYNYKVTYDHVGMSVLYLKSKFLIKSKYVTMLLVASEQPFASSSIVSDCGVPEDQLTQTRYSEADLLPDLEFKRGDYLFCVKESATDECAASDYKWLDKDTTTLVSARPSNPRQNAWLTNAKQKPSCSEADGGQVGYNFNIGGIPIGATIPANSRFKLYGDFSHGDHSEQWPNAGHPFGVETNGTTEAVSPYVVYYLEKDNQTTSGTELKLDITYNVENFIFVSSINSSDIASKSLAEVLKNVYTKNDWALEQKGINNVEGYSWDHLSAMTATPAVVLSGGTDEPTTSKPEK